MPFVLVHGGGFAASCWDELVPLLDRPAYAVDLPGRGRRPAELSSLTLSDFAQAVVDDIETHDLTDVVLVGHSMAGLTLPRVAGLVPDRLAQLVFVSCAVPPHGASMLDVLSSLSPAVAQVAERIGDAAMTADGALHHELAAVMFCNDMTEEQTTSTLARMGPESLSVLAEPCDLSGLAAPIPRSYVRLRDDASITLEEQDAMIENLRPIDVVDLASAHMAMISHPEALAEMLNAL